VRRTLVSFVAGLFVVALLASSPASAAPTVPQQAQPRGQTYETWLRSVGQWFLGDASNPLFAGLEGECGQVVDGVFFMIAPISPDQEFQCDVPTGTPIVLSHAGWFSTEGIDGETDAELEQAAEAGFVYSANWLTVDGQTVPLQTVTTGAYDVISEPGSFYDQILGLGTGPVRTVVTGDVVFIHPLTPGEHVIEAAVTFAPASNGDYSATYNVHVG
jgi:hypothetical protein